MATKKKNSSEEIFTSYTTLMRHCMEMPVPVEPMQEAKETQAPRRIRNLLHKQWYANTDCFYAA